MVQFNSLALLLVNGAIASSIDDHLNAILESKKHDVKVTPRHGFLQRSGPSAEDRDDSADDDEECREFWEEETPDDYDPFLGTIGRLGEVPCNDDNVCDMKDLPDFGSFPATCDAVTSNIETELAYAGLVVSCDDSEVEYINLPFCAASACAMGLTLEGAEPFLAPFFPNCTIDFYEMGGSDDDLYDDFGSTECGIDFYNLFEEGEYPDFSLGLFDEKGDESCIRTSNRGFCYFDDHVDEYQTKCLDRGGIPLKLLAEFQCRDKGFKFHDVFRNTPVCMGKRCDQDKFIEYLYGDVDELCDDGDFRIEPDVGQDVGIGDKFGYGSFECAYDTMMLLEGFPFLDAFEKDPECSADPHTYVCDWSQYADDFKSECDDSGRVLHMASDKLEGGRPLILSALPMCIASECEAPTVAKRMSGEIEPGITDTFKAQNSTPVPCWDDPKNYFYQRGDFRTCGWLSNLPPLQQARICRKPQVSSLPAAKDICTTTCESERSFNFNSSTKTCGWLADRQDSWKRWICNNNQSAMDMCPVTCGECDDR